jgi:hypothetical protein
MSKPALTVVCWKWQAAKAYRSTFGAEAVNTLRRMVARHYARPHRFCCVTNDAEGLDPQVEVIPDREDFKDLPSPHGGHNPSCYRRLRLFEPEAGATFGPRYVSLDLDCVIVRDMILLQAGARTKVWTDFDPKRSPLRAMQHGNFGSDQAWISYSLGKGEAKWTREDGVYSYRNEIRTRGGQLPPNARIVMFHGLTDPWSPEAQRLPWVRQHWV